MSNKTPRTMWEAGAERRAQHAEWARIDAAAKSEKDRVDGILKANPQIGILMRKGKHMYYVNFPTYCEAADPAQLAN